MFSDSKLLGCCPGEGTQDLTHGRQFSPTDLYRPSPSVSVVMSNLCCLEAWIVMEAGHRHWGGSTTMLDLAPNRP